MTQEEFYSELSSSKLPVFYGRAKEGTKVPFIVYTFVRVPELIADDRNYTKKYETSIQLITNSKTSLNETSRTLESILDNIAPYSVMESWSDDELIYINTYMMEI